LIKYLGSKRRLIPEILLQIRAVPGVGSVVDLFSGTARVGHALKGAGYRVLANDHHAYAETLARCYVEADREAVEREARLLIGEFNGLRGEPGYFTETFCRRSRFFQPHNGARIDAIREAIEAKGLPPLLKAVVLVSLMEAADRVDSTTGLQMAFLKQWAPRAHNQLELRMVNVQPRSAGGPCEAHGLDAEQAARKLHGDLVYLDPPYNQHSYLSNYHIWETLVRWDKPEVYGKACKRVDCRERKSIFNSRKNAADAMRRLLAEIRAPALLISFSDEGYLSRGDLESMLRARGGELFVRETGYRRYVGAQIGIHNLRGEKVGQVSHLQNTEFLFLWLREGIECAFPAAPPEQTNWLHYS